MELAEIEMLVGELELRVDRLRALYDQYFMGIEKLEPMVPRKDVERRFQTLRKEQIRNTAVRFKFQTILQRYNTYQTYWMRICRQIEEGTYRRDVMRAHRRFGNEPVKGAKRASERPRAPEVEGGAPDPATSPLPPRPATPLPVEVDLLRNLQPDGALDIDVEWSAVTEDPFPKPPPSQQTPHPIAESRPRTMRIAPLASLPPGMMPSFAPRPAGVPGDIDRRISIAPRGRLPSSSGEDPKIVVARRSATIVPEGGVSIAPPRGLTMLPESPSLPSARGASLPPAIPRPAPSAPNAPAAPAPERAPGAPRPSIAAPPAPAAPNASPRPPASPIAPQAPVVSMPAGGRTVSPPRPAASPTALPPPVPSRAPAAPPPASAARGDLAEDRVRQLYSQYIDTKRKHNESTAAITYEGLAASLRQSSEKLREKHGKSRSVDFEVIVKDGKTILRPIVK